MRKALPLVFLLFVLLILSSLSLLTVFDSEWQDQQVVRTLRRTYSQLNTYKKEHQKFPQSLSEANISDKSCIFLKCFTVTYQVSPSQDSYTLAAKVNDPFVAFFDFSCPIAKDSAENNRALCGSLGFKEDYTGARTDHAVYRKDPYWFATPSAWPKLN